jgi:Uma2 family endonuclease
LRRLTVVFDRIVEDLGKGEMFPGANLTDRVENWETNFRCPDIVVVLDETRLKNLDSAIVGGPDFLIEIASPGDRWPEKLPFYASIGVRELLILNRDTRHLELFRLTQGVMNTVDTSNRSEATELTSEVLPLSFQWVQKSGKPKVTIERNDGQQGQWIV